MKNLNQRLNVIEMVHEVVVTCNNVRKLFRPFHLTAHFVFDVIVWLASVHDDSSLNC